MQKIILQSTTIALECAEIMQRSASGNIRCGCPPFLNLFSFSFDAGQPFRLHFDYHPHWITEANPDDLRECVCHSGRKKPGSSLLRKLLQYTCNRLGKAKVE